MGAKTLAWQISTALVILLFGFVGTVKVVPAVSSNLHNEMRSKFSSYARIPPFDLIRLDPGLYMLIVGLTEVICATVIILYFFLPFLGRPSVLATWALLVLMFGALYTHFMVGDAVSDMGGAFFGLAIVLIRLYTMDAQALWHAEIKIKV